MKLADAINDCTLRELNQLVTDKTQDFSDSFSNRFSDLMISLTLDMGHRGAKELCIDAINDLHDRGIVLDNERLHED